MPDITTHILVGAIAAIVGFSVGSIVSDDGTDRALTRIAYRCQHIGQFDVQEGNQQFRFTCSGPAVSVVGSWEK